jgi:hypothetical protein
VAHAAVSDRGGQGRTGQCMADDDSAAQHGMVGAQRPRGLGSCLLEGSTRGCAHPPARVSPTYPAALIVVPPCTAHDAGCMSGCNVQACTGRACQVAAACSLVCTHIACPTMPCRAVLPP